MKLKRIFAIVMALIIVLQVMMFTVLAENDRRGYIFVYTWSDADMGVL